MRFPLLAFSCISSKNSLACPPVAELSSAGCMVSLAFSQAWTSLLKKTAFSPSYFSTNSLSGSGQSCAQTHTDTTRGRKDLENDINEPCAHLKPHVYPHLLKSSWLLCACSLVLSRRHVKRDSLDQITICTTAWVSSKWDATYMSVIPL